MRRSLSPGDRSMLGPDTAGTPSHLRSDRETAPYDTRSHWFSPRVQRPRRLSHRHRRRRTIRNSNRCCSPSTTFRAVGLLLRRTISMMTSRVRATQVRATWATSAAKPRSIRRSTLAMVRRLRSCSSVAGQCSTSLLRVSVGWRATMMLSLSSNSLTSSCRPVRSLPMPMGRRPRTARCRFRFGRRQHGVSGDRRGLDVPDLVCSGRRCRRRDCNALAGVGSGGEGELMESLIRIAVERAD